MLISWILNLSLAWSHEQGHQLAFRVKCEEVLQNQYVSLSQKHSLAQGKLIEIENFVKSHQGHGLKQLVEIQEAASAAVNKHHHIYLKAKKISKLDYPRHLKILEEIGNFDSSEGVYSLYKIKQSIVGRYSLKEYVHCKE